MAVWPAGIDCGSGLPPGAQVELALTRGPGAVAQGLAGGVGDGVVDVPPVVVQQGEVSALGAGDLGERMAQTRWQ